MIKKLMLGLGTIATTIPVATIVSCGDNKITPKDDAMLEIIQDPQTGITSTPEQPVAPQAPEEILANEESENPTGLEKSETPPVLAGFENIDDTPDGDAEWGIAWDASTNTLTIDTREGKTPYAWVLDSLVQLIYKNKWDSVKLITSIVVQVSSATDITLPIGNGLSGLSDADLVGLTNDKIRATRAEAIIAVILKALEPGGALEQVGLDETWIFKAQP